jgi:hypothetical protein
MLEKPRNNSSYFFSGLLDVFSGHKSPGFFEKGVKGIFSRFKAALKFGARPNLLLLLTLDEGFVNQ